MLRSVAVSVLLAAWAAACTTPDYRGWRGPAPAVAEARVEEIPLPPPADPELTNQPHLTLVRLAGDGYQRGFQYGRRFAPEWRRATRELEAHAVAWLREYVPLEFLARFAVHQVTALVARSFSAGDSEAHVPGTYRAYLQGIADGAGLESDDLLRTLAIVMLSDASCSAFVAFGPATEDGRLLQMRNLDWGAADLPASEATVLVLHEPPAAQRWLSVGVLGLVGSLSGINESGISLSEIGAGSGDTTWGGMPMPILMEQVLAEAHTLDEAVALMRRAPGSGGYNFMIGSARERRGAVVEKNAHRTAVFEIGAGNYADNPWFRGYAGFDCRADTAADPAVRAVQEASGGPGPPEGHNAYEARYRKQLELFEGFGRVLDVPKAEQLAREVAPRNNLHSILYDYERGRVYVRNQAWFADRSRTPSKEERLRTRAAAQPAAVLDLHRWFRGVPAAAPATAARRARPVVPGPGPAAPAPAAGGLPPPQIVRR